jgi:hypothetical protein
MGFSTFSGPLRSGTVREGAARNTGLAVLTQSYDTGVVTAGVGNVDVQIGILPQGAQILNVFVDQVVVPGGSSTSTISVGVTSGGATLFPATATTAGGRFPTAVPSTAVTLAFTNSAATVDTPIWVRYAVGTAAGVGRAVISIIYVQRAPNGAQNPASA